MLFTLFQNLRGHRICVPVASAVYDALRRSLEISSVFLSLKLVFGFIDVLSLCQHHCGCASDERVKPGTAPFAG